MIHEKASLFGNEWNKRIPRSLREFLSDHPSHGTRTQQLETWMPQAFEEYNRAQTR